MPQDLTAARLQQPVIQDFRVRVRAEADRRGISEQMMDQMIQSCQKILALREYVDALEFCESVRLPG